MVRIFNHHEFAIRTGLRIFSAFEGQSKVIKLSSEHQGFHGWQRISMMVRQ